MGAPRIVVLAGPNGVGKTTVSRTLVRDQLGIDVFVNADIIAQGLAGFRPEQAAVTAGRLMLRQLDALAMARASFSFETTLASRTFAPWLKRHRRTGYEVFLVFVWVPSPDVCVARIGMRVAAGGHHVPEEVVRRRFSRGVDNFRTLYAPLVDRWWFYDNSLVHARLVAHGGQGRLTVEMPDAWRSVAT